MKKYLLITFIVVCLDQLSKVYIKSSYLLYESKNIIGSFLKFTYIENPGIVFGLEVHSIIYYIITLMSFFIIIYIYMLIKDLHHIYPGYDLSLVAFSMILGGAIGNIIDRIFVIFSLFDYFGVIDFIDVGFENYRFYIFNISDMSVSIGILLFIYYTYIQNNSLDDYGQKI